MDVLRPFRYWTLWMVKTHTVTWHCVITVYNDMFDHMDGVMRTLAKTKTHRKEDLFFAVKLASQMLSKYHAEVTAPMGKLPISAHILDSFRKLRTFRKMDNGMDTISEDETSYTTQYQQAVLKNVENEYCPNHRCVPVNQPETIPSSYLVPSTLASESGESSIDPYRLSCDNNEYLPPHNLVIMTPGQSNCAAHLLTAARPHLHSPPEAPKN